MECSRCKQTWASTKELKYPCFPCDSCRNLCCVECSDLGPSEIKCMPLHKRLLKFHCYKCRSGELVDCLKNTILDKDEIISGKNELIELLKEKLSRYEAVQGSPKISYADAISSQRSRTEEWNPNCPDIIVRPKIAQDTARTKADISRKLIQQP